MIRLLWGLKPWIFAPQTATTALTSWNLGAKKCAAWYGVKMDSCKNKCTNQCSCFFENLTAKIWLQTCISSAKVGVCSQCNVLQIFSMPSHTKKVWTSFFQPRKTHLEGFALKYLTLRNADLAWGYLRGWSGQWRQQPWQQSSWVHFSHTLWILCFLNFYGLNMIEQISILQ